MALLPQDPKQQKRLALGVAPVLVVAVLWYFYYDGMQEEVQTLTQNVERLETRNASARSEMARLAQIRERFDRYETHIARLEELIPQSEEVPALLHMVNVRAQETGVEIYRVTPQGEEPGAHYVRHRYEISVAGAYHDIGRFLTAIGSLERIITPVNLQMVGTHGPDRNGNMRIEIRFQIETYVVPAREPAEEGADARA